MNANEISSKTNPRLNRIKIVSRIVRYVLLAMFVLIICIFLLSLVSTFRYFRHSWSAMLFNAAFQIVLCLWYWKLAQLFRFYERGLIFAFETIRCIKILGFLCIVSWILLSISHLLHLFSQPSSHPLTLQPGVTLTSVEEYRFGFFSFIFAGINFGQLLSGIIIVLIAWIMDEGRKIQEEQELTV